MAQEKKINKPQQQNPTDKAKVDHPAGQAENTVGHSKKILRNFEAFAKMSKLVNQICEKLGYSEEIWAKIDQKIVDELERAVKDGFDTLDQRHTKNPLVFLLNKRTGKYRMLVFVSEYKGSRNGADIPNKVLSEDLNDPDDLSESSVMKILHEITSDYRGEQERKLQNLLEEGGVDIENFSSRMPSVFLESSYDAPKTIFDFAEWRTSRNRYSDAEDMRQYIEDVIAVANDSAPLFNRIKTARAMASDSSTPRQFILKNFTEDEQRQFIRTQLILKRGMNASEVSQQALDYSYQDELNAPEGAVTLFDLF